jgi:Domain of unknown function (DUF4145)
MPAMTCPYPDCGAYAEMALASNLQPVGIDGRGQVNFAVWSCRVCGRYILGEISSIGAPENYVPHPTGVTHGLFEHVPQTIASDARQAFLCFQVGAWRAAAAMARRALQASAYDKNAPNRKLILQIDWLAENGIITHQMREVAHQIRLGGNLGAHPDSDGLLDIDQEAAGRILRFLTQFFTYVYTIPGQLEEVPPDTDGPA